MTISKKTLLLGAFTGLVFLILPSFKAFAYTTHYYQLIYDTATPQINEGNAIAQNFTNYCDTFGDISNIEVMLSTYGSSTIQLLLRYADTQGVVSWYSQKNFNYATATPAIFNIASSTLPRLETCGNGFEGWFFQLTAVSGSFKLFGSISTTTAIAGVVKLPSTALCVQGISQNCGDVGELYLQLNGDFSTSTLNETINEIGNLSAETCNNLGTIAGSFCKVLTYLFVPTSASLTQYSNLKDMLILKPPFGYWNSIKTDLNNLTATGTPAFSLTSQLQNITIFATLKTGLTWILWLIFGIWVIIRIARFDF